MCHEQWALAVIKLLRFLPCDAMHIAAIAGMRCPSVWLSARLSVCLSVTFVSCAKTNKDIFEIYSPRGSQAILVFPYQTEWRYSRYMRVIEPLSVPMCATLKSLD